MVLTESLILHGQDNRVADQAAHQGRGQGLLSLQKVVRSRGLCLPAGPLLTGGVRLWLSGAASGVGPGGGLLRPEKEKIAYAP